MTSVSLKNLRTTVRNTTPEVKATRHTCSTRLPARCFALIVVVFGLTDLSVGTTTLMGAEPGAAAPSNSTPSDSGQLNWVAKGSQPARGTTQHNLSIARRIDASRATQGVDNSQVTVLRWRTPGVAQTQLSGNGSAQATKIATVSAIQSGQHAVRQVSATDLDLPAAIPDAFDDPFEDGAQRPATGRIAWRAC